MKRLIVVLLTFVTLCAYGGQRELIWPKGKMPDAQPGQIAAMTDEVRTDGFKADKHRIAYIEWFEAPAPEKRNGACMILISGGAYNNAVTSSPCRIGMKNSRPRAYSASISCIAHPVRWGFLSIRPPGRMASALSGWCAAKRPNVVSTPRR